MDRKQMKIDKTIKRIDKIKHHLERTNYINSKTMESLFCLLGDAKRELIATERTQREFKNKDFHVIVWEDSERIGLETKWIREGFGYRETFGNSLIHIDNQWKTDLSLVGNVWFGINNGVTKSAVCKELRSISYTDIVKELEKAHELSREVSIWDVIEECKGVTDVQELNRILDKYEFKNRTLINCDWTELRKGSLYLDQPYRFVIDGCKLRLKEQC